MPSGKTGALLGISGSKDYASKANDLFCGGGAGMMGVAVDLEFAKNRRIYVYSTSNLCTPHTNLLKRFMVGKDFSNVSERTDIVDDLPYKMRVAVHPSGVP